MRKSNWDYVRRALGVKGHPLARAFAELKYEVHEFGLEEVPGIPSNFDLYVKVSDGMRGTRFPRNLKPSVFWASDTHLRMKEIQVQVGDFDFVFCAQKDALGELSRCGSKVSWLPHACYPKWQSAGSKNRTIDIAWVGVFHTLKKSFPEFGRERLLFYRALGERYRNCFIGRAAPWHLGRVYGKAKIGVNKSIRNDINLRCFEIMCGGALLITDRIDVNGFDELFIERQHVVTYLEHPDERTAIAQAGCSHVLAHHTFHHRARSILDTVLSGGGRAA
jgi:hypothetical protein